MIQESASGGIGIIPSYIELSKVDALYGNGYNAICKALKCVVAYILQFCGGH